jgi:hypothetical protein
MPTPKVQTLGQLLVRDILPEDIPSDRVLDKGGVSVLFTELAEKYPDRYVDIMKELNDFSEMSASGYGNGSSIRLKDLKLPPRIKEYRNRLQERIHKITQSNLPMEQKSDKLVELMRGVVSDVQDKLITEAYDSGNNFAITAKHGIKGNPLQLAQLLIGDLMVTDHKGRPIPIPGVHSYGAGTIPSEYWAGSYTSRSGYSAVQFATAETGYLGKQLAMMANRVRVTGDDCGVKDAGITRDGNDPELVGSVLARDVNGLKAGTVVTREDLPKLRDKDVVVRSLLTCQQEDGVCKHCAGKQYDNEFPKIGEFIGIRAARAVAEPMTQQLGLSAKHAGTTVGAVKKDIHGFPEINRFLQVPERFASKSVLAPADGKVENIVDAPQGGKYLIVNGQQLYSPPERELLIKKGDTVEAGDMLTDGTPNPIEIAKYKGLGEGRKYFTEKFSEILKNNKVGSHRSNIEVLGRAFFDRVRITNPNGMYNYEFGDIVPYSAIQRQYTPRDTSKVKPVKSTLNGYLEQPVLHYSIGTRVTPKVANTLLKNEITEIMVNDTEPDFEPAPVRLAGFAAQDPDWKTRLAGTGLKKSITEGAMYGASSPHNTTSYVPGLMNPSRLN